MAFDTAISGLQAAATELDVIGNNVANAGSVGFKSSRAEFSDMYASSLMGASAGAVGIGTRLADVTQQFSQGTFSFTNNSLDLAIDGQGFFRLNDGGATVFTRAGAFGTDAEGFIVNSSNQRLTGFVADAAGELTGRLGDLRVDANNIQPTPTSRVDGALNLDAGSEPPTEPWPAAPFAFGDAGPDPDTYNSATSLSIYDSLGNSHALALYFVNTGANAWDVHALIDGVSVGATPAGALQFGADGAIDPATSTLNIAGWQPLGTGGAPNGAGLQDFDISLLETTQYGSPFGVNAMSQDGFTTGQLSRVAIDSDGVIFSHYTNGQSRALGQVALVNFANPGGLQQLGDSSWGETPDSGTPLLGAPGTASLGMLQAGALEESNVDVTAELVKLILAQRNYQANAQTIQTADTVTQTIINLR